MTIGILALQGDFREHADILKKLNADFKYVRNTGDLDEIDALIIPGGESTSMIKLINANNMRKALTGFITNHPVMGTCAGLILLAKVVVPDQFSFQALDIEVERNAYGAQLDSFNEKVQISDKYINTKSVNVAFIRAPKITKILSESVEILSSHNNSPIMVRQDNILGLTFHPEITEETEIHKMFIEMV